MRCVGKGVHSSRPRANTSMWCSGNSSSMGDWLPRSKHIRATSELSILQSEQPDCRSIKKRNQSQLVAEDPRNKLAPSSERSVNLVSEPSIDSNLVKSRPGAVDFVLDENLHSGTVRKLPTSVIMPTQQNLKHGTLTTVNPSSIELENSKVSVTLEILVDRLLSPLMSKLDAKFVSTFLCLYRIFAAPSDLANAIITRFRVVNESQETHISRVTSQLRYLGILAQWVSGYPGDFAHPITRQITTQFLSGLSKNRIFAAARAEMSTNLDAVIEDDDTDWACSDISRNTLPKTKAVQSISSIINPDSCPALDSIKQDALKSSAVHELSKHPTGRHSMTSSTASSLGRSDSHSSTSCQSQLDLAERARREAQFLVPTPRISLGKAQWHRLMDVSEDDIARELTRIDWLMYTSIKPRDLVRHVTLPADERAKCKGLENVDRMVNHFNHVAFWVANLVLLRDKPKHRARILERFMRIAWVSESASNSLCFNRCA